MKSSKLKSCQVPKHSLRFPDCPDDSSAGVSNFACRHPGCGSTFAKSHQFLMHVKMDHNGGTEEEMESTWKMAKEELFTSKCSGASMPCTICGEMVRRSRGEQGGLGGGEPEHIPNEIRHTPIKCLSGERRIGEECDCVCSVKNYTVLLKRLYRTRIVHDM